jgi:hypothetical protein
MPGGSGAALDEALGQFETEAEADQAELFEVVGALDAPSPLSRLFERRGRGRPKGSKNKRTETVAAWLLAQHRHPLAVLAEAYSMSPTELAARIGLEPVAVKDPKTGEVSHRYDNETLLAIYKLQMGFAVDLAPYVAQRQAQAVQVQGAGGDFQLAFVGVSLPARGGPAESVGGPVIDGQTLRLPAKSDD